MNERPPQPEARRTERFGRGVETVLLALTLGGMIVLATAQIALRNLGGGGIAWADEALRIMVLWVTMLGAIAASGEQRHVSIDALSRYLPVRVRRATDVIVNALTSVVCAVLAWYSYLFVVDSWSADDRVLGGSVPAWSLQVILPVGFALIACRYAAAAGRGVTGRRSRAPTP